jgi:hypothetical protein
MVGGTGHREVLERDGHRCLACGATTRLHVDHIKPVSRGGRNDLDNLQTLCVTCNARKGVAETSYLSPRGSESHTTSDGSQSPPPRGSYRSSTEGPKTFKGKGKGKGPGTGRGQGYTDIDARARREAWADEHLPDLPAEFVVAVLERLDRRGRPLDAAEIRAAVIANYPSLQEAA